VGHIYVGTIVVPSVMKYMSTDSWQAIGDATQSKRELLMLNGLQHNYGVSQCGIGQTFEAIWAVWNDIVDNVALHYTLYKLIVA